MRKEWRKRIRLPLAGILSLFFAFIMTSSAEAAQSVVYTSMTEGITTSSGDGTKENPYNKFEDAVKNVADGGTIYILAGKSALLNDADSQNKPFVINKSVRILSDSDTQKATLNSRAAGIVLGADVTFENIEMNVTNKQYAQIFANGHSLTLKNVTRVPGTRLLHIVAGGLALNESGLPDVGQSGRVTIQGKCEFGNIYAGSINDAFWGDSSIHIENITADSKLGNIYAGGADAAIVSGDWFGGEEPPAPQPNPQAYGVIGKVDVLLGGAPVMAVDGEGAQDGTEVVCKSEYARGYHSFLNVSKLTVQGELRPKQLTALAGKGLDLSVQSEGVLNLTDKGDLEINNFAGGGRLVLNTNAVMTVYGKVTGSTVFETEKYKGNNSYSGIVTENHVYIKTAPDSEGVFTFEPYPTQEKLQLKKQTDGGWKIVGQEESKPPVEPEEPPPPVQPEESKPPVEPEQPKPETPAPTLPTPTPPTPTPPPAVSEPSSPSVTAPQTGKISLSRPKVKLKKGKKYAVIKYNKVKGADGYEIYRSTKKKSGYKKVVSTKKTTYKNKKLKSKRKYYYKVRAYRKVNGKKIYSAYSTVKAVKVK